MFLSREKGIFIRNYNLGSRRFWIIKLYAAIDIQYPWCDGIVTACFMFL